MKKLLFIALLSMQFIHAQKEADSTAILNRKNEVRVDLLSLATDGRLNLTYERFLNKDFSLGITFGMADNDQVNEDFDKGYRNTVPKYDITPFVRYNLSKGQRSFYFAEVFASANGGDFKETVRRTDEVGNAYYVNEKSDYTDFAIGAGLGYKLYFSQKFAVELMVGFGTNLFNKEKSPDTVSRVGVSFGYRF
jgi:hypothetical protein